MNEKVLLILIDGMRPDSLERSGHPYIEQMKSEGSFTLEAQTVMPSVTLPCHMSLFHSVPPQRHGILDNRYVSQVRPIPGLYEQLHANRKTCALFHNWSELQDLARPGSLAYSCFISGAAHTYEVANKRLTDKAIEYIREELPDFTFLYLGLVDEIGHKHGWMSDEYIQAVYDSWVCIEQAARMIPEDYTIIVTSDHGGHDRTHGTTMPEDMTIPIFMRGKAFVPGKHLADANIIDIAPTITQLLGVQSDKDWEGKCLE
ncbi:alkaline phosphatase family protein [Paenibacillus cymbidii]|uniref:alkaline phosphatase family protein n=1 Tax=Paenibacillus cymbidii TaxID=1639034 RepID=UPI0010806D86|nr:ectonucleotide pyrophosphatase/phosphodiesterase [Paenibacillus cymbidii]